MRASPRKRSVRVTGPWRSRAVACAVAGGLALGLACSAGPLLAQPATPGKAPAPAKAAVAKPHATVVAAKAVTPAKTVVPTPAKAVHPARPVAVAPAKPAAPAPARAVTPAPAKAVPPAPAKPAVEGKAVPVAPAKPATPARPTMPTKIPPPALAAPGRALPRARTNTVPVHAQVPAVVASMRPAVSAVPAPAAPAARLDDQVTYQYNALGRRDPFMPLIDGAEYVPVEAPPDVGAIKVVGIVWGAEDKFAIIEDGRGNSSVLRPGDKVMNGVVEGLKRDGVIVTITVDGQSQSVTIPLTRKGDSNANH